jgi:hypothetical protein
MNQIGTGTRGTTILGCRKKVDDEAQRARSRKGTVFGGSGVRARRSEVPAAKSPPASSVEGAEPGDSRRDRRCSFCGKPALAAGLVSMAGTFGSGAIRHFPDDAVRVATA